MLPETKGCLDFLPLDTLDAQAGEADRHGDGVDLKSAHAFLATLFSDQAVGVGPVRRVHRHTRNHHNSPALVTLNLP